MYNLTSEAEQYFQELAKDRKATKAACLYIDNILNKALNRQDIRLLLSLILYIEKGDGELAYKYIGETHRILRILHIIELEQKYNMELFCSECGDKAALMEKYSLSLFAFRRLLFRLSDASREDAIFCLHRNRLSVFAVYVITQDDLILPNSSFYREIMEIYSDLWNDSERQLFFSLTQSS